MLTGRVRRGQAPDVNRAAMFRYFADERRLEAVEQFVALADEVGVKLTHLALAFVLAHPGVTSAILGPRTREQLDDLLARRTSRSTTPCWTGSTRSSRPVRTSACSTCSTGRPRSPTPPCGVARSPPVPPPDGLAGARQPKNVR